MMTPTTSTTTRSQRRSWRVSGAMTEAISTPAMINPQKTNYGDGEQNGVARYAPARREESPRLPQLHSDPDPAGRQEHRDSGC